jgi:hypothetical protein
MNTKNYIKGDEILKYLIRQFRNASSHPFQTWQNHSLKILMLRE